MKSSKELLTPIANSQKLKTPIAYRDLDKVEKITPFEADELIKSNQHLISDQKYKPFFYRKLYNIGQSAFMSIARRAEEGNNPPALFVYLLREYDK